MILIDVDHFKEVNDGFGHSKGDAVLRHLAYVIRKQLRAFDLAYRIGGDEFVVLLPGSGPESCAGLAERIRAAVVAEPIEAIPVTVSCGVGGSAPGGTFDYGTVFAAADAALYEAKRGGRNRIGRDSARRGASMTNR